MSKDLQNEKALLESPANTFNELKSTYKLWTDRLLETAEKLTTHLSTMGLPEYLFSTNERDAASARLTLFFKVLSRHWRSTTKLELYILLANLAGFGGTSSSRCSSKWCIGTLVPTSPRLSRACRKERTPKLPKSLLCRLVTRSVESLGPRASARTSSLYYLATNVVHVKDKVIFN